MSGEYWDVGQWKETPTGKNFFVKLGSAKQKADGGFYIEFDALPLQRPDDKGNVRCSVVIQQPKGSFKPAQSPRQDNDSGSVPF